MEFTIISYSKTKLAIQRSLATFWGSDKNVVGQLLICVGENNSPFFYCRSGFVRLESAFSRKTFFLFLFILSELRCC